MRTILVTNETTLPDSQVQTAVAAVHLQVGRDFTPTWGIQSRVVFWPGPGQPPPGSEIIHVLDDATAAGVLGYHDDAAGAVPEGFVFARTAEQYGDRWEATLSHEVLEQLADPYCDQLVLTVWRGAWAALAKETADPVENDEYEINGVPVSNFILPSWFGPAAATRVDFLGTLHGPLTLRPSGYQSWTRSLRTWQQTFGEAIPRHQKATSPYGRRWRRMQRRALR